MIICNIFFHVSKYFMYFSILFLKFNLINFPCHRLIINQKSFFSAPRISSSFVYRFGGKSQYFFICFNKCFIHERCMYKDKQSGYDVCLFCGQWRRILNSCAQFSIFLKEIFLICFLIERFSLCLFKMDFFRLVIYKNNVGII